MNTYRAYTHPLVVAPLRPREANSGFTEVRGSRIEVSRVPQIAVVQPHLSDNVIFYSLPTSDYQPNHSPTKVSSPTREMAAQENPDLRNLGISGPTIETIATLPNSEAILGNSSTKMPQIAIANENAEVTILFNKEPSQLSGNLPSQTFQFGWPVRQLEFFWTGSPTTPLGLLAVNQFEASVFTQNPATGDFGLQKHLRLHPRDSALRNPTPILEASLVRQVHFPSLFTADNQGTVRSYFLGDFNVPDPTRLTPSPKPVFTLKHPITSLRASPSQHIVAAGTQKGKIAIYSAQERNQKVYRGLNQEPVTELQFSKTGHRILGVTQESNAFVMNTQTGAIPFEIPKMENSFPIKGFLLRSGNYALTLNDNGKIYLWDIREGGPSDKKHATLTREYQIADSNPLKVSPHINGVTLLPKPDGRGPTRFIATTQDGGIFLGEIGNLPQ